MIIKIKGQAFDRKTGEKIGRARWETIDTKKNELFSGVDNLAMAKTIFESFWNDLNPHSTEIVSCLDIKKQS